MQVIVAPPYPKAGRYADLQQDAGGPIKYYAGLLQADPRMTRHVLDVGCGPDYPGVDPMRRVMARCQRLDGVDPDAEVNDHPHLTRRWCTMFEQADIPRATYDAIMTYNVAEHIERPGPFLAKACEVLKPGGVFYAFTPHAAHPFALLSQTVQKIGLKRLYRRHVQHKINPYPAYYRLNRMGLVLRAARGLDFAQAEFHYLPTLRWQRYFVAPLRFLPRLYDRLLGIRYRRCAALFVFKLEKAEHGAPGA